MGAQLEGGQQVGAQLEGARWVEAQQLKTLKMEPLDSHKTTQAVPLGCTD